jgi:hypothetical protein
MFQIHFLFKNPTIGWGQWGEMNQSLYAHMNNKRKMKKKSYNYSAVSSYSALQFL